MGVVRIVVLALVGCALAVAPALAAGQNEPVNQSPPVLGPNDVVVGGVATVTSGTWSGEDATSTFTYQWYRYVGQVAEAIPGATGQSYTATAADEGGLVVLVTVTADSGTVSNDAYSNAVAVPAPYPPSSIAAPVLSGTGASGSTLHVSTGTWSQYPSPIAGPLSYTYQWMRLNSKGNVVIPGATQASFVVEPAELGWALAVKVTATDMIGSTFAYSNGLRLDQPASTPPLTLPEPTTEGDCGRGCALSTSLEDPVIMLGDSGELPQLLKHDGYTASYFPLVTGTIEVCWELSLDEEETCGPNHPAFAFGHAVDRGHLRRWTHFKVRLTRLGQDMLEHHRQVRVYPIDEYTPLHGDAGDGFGPCELLLSASPPTEPDSKADCY